MSIKRGDVISHSGASEWGVGKVLEVGPCKVTICFNDGVTRKIISSHLGSLLPAEPALFIPHPEVVQKVVTKTISKVLKKVKAKPVRVG